MEASSTKIRGVVVVSSQDFGHLGLGIQRLKL